MAKDQTKKSRFPSIYSDSWVTEAQFIVETLFSNIAEKSGKEFPRRFWAKDKKLEQEFVGQIATANSLLKKYSIKIILSLLRSPEGKNISSLRMPNISKLLNKHKKIIETAPQKGEFKNDVETNITEKPVVFEKSKSILSKLD